ncbi:MAG: MFS transporter [Acidobacteria bacterium]|nr:MAG: MFS transporter [Acidobacteriota bacterium]
MRGAAQDARSWRNLFTLTTAAFVGYTGFTLVMPFLPIYISQLGVQDVGEVAMWSGLSLGVTPALTALLSPAWGRLADRVGRKLMLERALASFVVVMTLMAFVRRPWQVFALRAVQGLFAGYGGLTIAMAAESAPRERMPAAIGMVQSAQRLGPAIGPVIGGVLAGLVGLRRAFLVTAGVYALALALAVVLYVEPRTRRASGEERGMGTGSRDILRLPNFALLLAVIFGIQYADRSLAPILPLYVVGLGVPTGRAPLVSGLLFSVVACAAAVGHNLGGRLLKRMTARDLITLGSTVAGAAIVGFALGHDILALGVAIGAFGLGVGLAMTAAFTAAGLVVPVGANATAFGFLNGAALAALAVSPVLSGIIGGSSMPAVFALDVAIAALVVLGVRRWMLEPGGHPQQRGGETLPPESQAESPDPL